MTTVKLATTPKIKECCICGDLGLSYLLFRCQDCQLRYQHKYCSNEYPAAKFYRLCNWCLSERDESSSSQKARNSMKLKSSSSSKKDGNYGGGGVKIDKGSVKKMATKPIIVKKMKMKMKMTTTTTAAAEGSPTLASRKRITTTASDGGRGGGDGGNTEVKLRRTESVKVENRGIIRKLELKNKVRRYKSLEDVSCKLVEIPELI